MSQLALVGFASDEEASLASQLLQNKTASLWFGRSSQATHPLGALYSLACDLDYELLPESENVALNGREKQEVVRAIQRTPEGYSCLLSDIDDFISFYINALCFLIVKRDVSKIVFSQRFEAGWIPLMRIVASKLDVACSVISQGKIIDYSKARSEIFADYKSYHSEINSSAKKLYLQKKLREVESYVSARKLVGKCLVVDSASYPNIDYLIADLAKVVDEHPDLVSLVDLYHCGGGEPVFALKHVLLEKGIKYFYSQDFVKTLEEKSSDLVFATNCLKQFVCEYGCSYAHSELPQVLDFSNSGKVA